jgi:flavin-dependent dehydrogenase
LPNAPINTARVLEVITDTSPHPASPKYDEPQSYLGEVAEGRKGSVAVFDFRPTPSGISGYTWNFPTQVKGLPARCWGIYDANLFVFGKRPALKDLLAAEMARAGFDLKDYELQGHPIRWFDPFLPLSTPRVLLVGDAAGVDVIFGEGISMALGYGKVAAGELAQAFRIGNFTLAGYRQRVLLSPLGQTLTARWIFAGLIYLFKWSWFQFLLWRILNPLVILLAWIFVLNWARRMR